MLDMNMYVAVSVLLQDDKINPSIQWIRAY